MDLGEQDEFGLGKRNGDHSNYQSTSLTSEWKFNHHSVDPSCPSISMVDSSCSNLYNNPGNSQTQIEKALPMYWNQGILPSSFSHFPTDSGFTKGAAKFSCFSGGNFSSILNNPFNTNETLSLYHRASRPLSDSLSPMDDQRDVKESNHEASEADFSGDGQNSSSKENGPRKRKRINQDMELDQVLGASPMSIKTTKEKVLDANKKGEQTSTTMVNAKPLGKNAKNSTAGDEDYVHLRARRGQATNSHSLAERVRREKISERMKLLQDLVPGCSKVTGKAVMLDEIINYVQSLQRQVEFLWMKLASVNPRPDFNKGLLSKDLLHLQGGSSTDIGFSSQKIHPQLHQSQQGLMQTGISSMAINAARMPQVPNAWEDELCNIHQMNFGNAHELNGKPRDGFFDK